MTFDPEPLLRILLAALLSLPIGLEREISGKDAGLRTHLLLAAATAGLGWLSIEAAEGRTGADATRIASYTVAGVGFLGAGLIVAIRGRVHGLTTAVAAFTVTAIGLLSGMGEGGTATALAAVSLLTLGPIDWVKPVTYGRFVRDVTVIHLVVDGPARVPAVQQMVADHPVQLQAIEFVPLGEDHLAVHLTVRGRGHELREVRRLLVTLEGVRSVVAAMPSGVD